MIRARRRWDDRELPRRMVRSHHSPTVALTRCLFQSKPTTSLNQLSSSTGRRINYRTYLNALTLSIFFGSFFILNKATKMPRDHSLRRAHFSASKSRQCCMSMTSEVQSSRLLKTLIAGCSKRPRDEAREKSTSKGVPYRYVKAKSIERNEVYESFSATCQRFKWSVQINTPRQNRYTADRISEGFLKKGNRELNYTKKNARER